MADKTTFIKLDRNIIHWGWYKDSNTKGVFLHLLLTANIKPGKFMKDTIPRGSLATSIGHIAKSVGITYDQARTALTHLKDTNEITITRRPKYLVISITNYNKYQDRPTQNPSKSQANPNQIPTIKEGKEEKNIPSVYIPSRGDLASFIESEGLNADPDDVFDYYEAVGWEIGGKPIKDWRAVVRRWKQYEAPKAEQAKRGTDWDKVNEYLDKLERGESIYD